MNKNTFRITLAVILLIGIAYAVQRNNHDERQVGESEGQEIVNLAPRSIPEGWEIYVSDGWSNGFRIAFAYPPQWNVEEKYETLFKGEGREKTILGQVDLIGEGYQIFIHQKGRGASADWISRDVDGYSAREWEGEYSKDGVTMFYTNLGVLGTGFIIELRTKFEDRLLFEEFMKTVAF